LLLLAILTPFIIGLTIAMWIIVFLPAVLAGRYIKRQLNYFTLKVKTTKESNQKIQQKKISGE
jgi:hypothetical protein